MACPHVGWAPAAALGITGGSAAVDGEGLAYDRGAEPADRPDTAGRGDGHGGQAAEAAWAGGWYLLPGGAVPVQDEGPVGIAGPGAAADGEAHRPGVARGGGAHTGQVVAGRRAGAGYARPFSAVPVQDQGLVAGSGVELSNRPGVAGGGGGHVGQVVAGTGVGAAPGVGADAMFCTLALVSCRKSRLFASCGLLCAIRRTRRAAVQHGSMRWAGTPVCLR